MEEYNINKPNRRKRQKNNSGSDWCHGCDMSLVPDGAKCKVCGEKNGKKYRDKQRAR